MYENILSNRHSHRGQWKTLDIFLCCYLPHFPEEGCRFSLNLKFAIFARLASKGVPGIFWSLTAHFNSGVIHDCGHIECFKKQALGIRTWVFMCIQQVLLASYLSSEPWEWLCFKLWTWFFAEFFSLQQTVVIIFLTCVNIF